MNRTMDSFIQKHLPIISTSFKRERNPSQHVVWNFPHHQVFKTHRFACYEQSFQISKFCKWKCSTIFFYLFDAAFRYSDCFVIMWTFLWLDLTWPQQNWLKRSIQAYSSYTITNQHSTTVNNIQTAPNWSKHIQIIMNVSLLFTCNEQRTVNVAQNFIYLQSLWSNCLPHNSNAQKQYTTRFYV